MILWSAYLIHAKKSLLIDRVLDAFHIALSTHMLYFYMVDMYGDLVGALGYPVWCVPGQTPNVNFVEDLL